MRIGAVLLAVLLLMVPSAARAITISDIVGLSNAGVSDTVLVALIDADRTVFSMTPTIVAQLHAYGVSDRAIEKMIRTQEEFEPPNFLVVGVNPMAPPESPVMATVPYFIPLPVPFVEPALRHGDREARVRRDSHDQHDRHDQKESKDGKQPWHHNGGSVSVGLRIRNGEFVR